MDPAGIVNAAKRAGLTFLAITDHNTLANVPAFSHAALHAELILIPGAEIQTLEEVHMIALFPGLDAAMGFDSVLYDVLPERANDPEFFGDQPVIDSNGNILRLEKKALINSVQWDLETTVQKVREHGGFCFPAHVDADSFSIFSQLGFLPPEPVFPVLGISATCDIESLRQMHPELAECALIRNSDAHYPRDVGRGWTTFTLAEPTIEALIDCLERGAGFVPGPAAKRRMG